MATDTKVYSVNGVFPADTSTFDIAVPGESRTPTGCVVFATRATALNTAAGHMNMTGGVSDFTTTAAICKTSENATGVRSEVSQGHQETNIIEMLNEGMTTVLRSATVAAIAGAIRLTPVQSGTAFRVMAIIVFGSKCKAFSVLGAAVNTTFTVAHGMGANGAGAGFYFFNEEGGTASTSGFWSFGVHSDKGTIKQQCFAVGEGDNASPTNNDSRGVSNRVGVRLTATGNENKGIELTSQDATNTTFTARTGGSTLDKFVGLLIECDDVQTDVQLVDSPTTAASDWNFNGLTFTSQFVCLVLNRKTTWDSKDSGSPLAGCFGAYCFDEDGNENCPNWAIENAVTADTDTQTRLDTKLFMAEHDGIEDFNMTNPTITSDGWDFAAADITTADATIRKWPMLAIEQAPVGGTTLLQMQNYRGMNRMSGGFR